MWAWIETGVTIIEHCLYAEFITRFLTPKKQGNELLCFLVIAVFSGGITLVFNQFMIFEGVLSFFRIVGNFTIAMLLLKGTLFEKLFASFITDAAVLLINFLTLNVMGVLFQRTIEELITDRGMLRIYILFITKVLFLLFTRLLIHLRQKDSFIFAPIEWIALSLVFAVTMFIELEIFRMTLHFDMSAQSPSAIGAAVGLITINILVYILMRRISQTNAEKTALLVDRMQLELYSTQLSDFEKQYQEMKQIRHDMKNHLQCISALLEQNDTERAQDYVNDMMQNKLKFGYAAIKTGNRVVDVIANTKLSQCSEEGIRTAVNISSFTLEMDDVDICIILGNLFDNAIEACRKLEGDRFVCFEMGQHKGYVKLVIQNSASGSVLKHNPKLRTTKAESNLHGVGLRSVKNTVEKYGGMVDLYDKPNGFAVDVWIPCKKEAAVSAKQ